ncbi:amino acid permease (GABA permease) [Friedmanniella endophytica]|uniref:Amino acid permease (GABA permease) n=1 Tax=Microlunatus kandeliicorticis TaxID=1759536 RepID=A0A7W3IQG6_9ACTN|nr:amino acid permease [Microlunatus kandeliicorticis]MBA8793352.1 amino acid permease (GABA permease) [Microlunatus kandeliicorticis]
MSSSEDRIIEQQMDADARALAELGYTQELKRGMSGFSNFAVSFSIISILAGCITSYKIALVSGGPSTLVLGWLIVGIMVLAVSAAMAEVCSKFPTAGGLYFWAGRLARRNKRQWAWFVGWFNFLGEVAVTAAIDFGCATTMMAFASLTFGVEPTAVSTFLLFVVIIVVHALLNTFGVNLVSLLSNVSAWWHLVGTVIIVGALWLLPEKHQSVGWTLTGFHNDTGWSSGIYVFALGLLMAQYTYTGYDASAHVAEETKNASVAAPRGIVTSVLVSVIGGFVLLYSITAAIPDKSPAALTALANSDTGLPPAQIFLDALNSPTVAKFLLFIVCVAQFFCGMASVTANSRMSYAFSRDRALPGHRLWAKVNPRTGTPTNSIWLCVTLSVILAVPSLFSTTAYLAVTSIAVIGLYIAYVVPVFLRRINPDFTVGPWNLGRWSGFVGWVAVVWVVIICVLFVLPPASPVTVSTFNYAPVAVLVVLVFATVSWLVAGKRNFMQGARDEHTTRDPDSVLGQ